MTQIEARIPRGNVSPGLFETDASGVLERFASYLSDESRMKGNAENVLFPSSEADIAAILTRARAEDRIVTVSAGRTGLVGGAVPQQGWGLSVERLATVSRFRFASEADEFRLHLGPGIPLNSLQKSISSAFFPFSGSPGEESVSALEEFRGQTTRWLFPPDPTETSAQLGGMAASNASGARTFHFGPTRNFIRGLKVVLANGSVLDIERGRCIAHRGEEFTITGAGEPPISIPVPAYGIPAGKHACGYHSGPELDLIDLFIGSEGTLGVISELEIALTRINGAEAEIVAIFPDIGHACRFVDSCRRDRIGHPGFTIEALEFMCSDSLGLLRREAGFCDIPNVFSSPQAVAVFIGMRVRCDLASAFCDLSALIADSGGIPSESPATFSAVDIERMKHLRHALPETINSLVARIREVHPRITKLGTDMAVPDEHLPAVIEMYRRKLGEARLNHFMFGHIGNNHLHVNIIPENPAQYDAGRAIYLDFAREVVGMGGSVSAEHGIGKLKKYLLSAQFEPAALDQMRAVKSALDPDWRLGRGNLFDR